MCKLPLAMSNLCVRSLNPQSAVRIINILPPFCRSSPVIFQSALLFVLYSNAVMPFYMVTGRIFISSVFVVTMSYRDTRIMKY